MSKLLMWEGFDSQNRYFQVLGGLLFSTTLLLTPVTIVADIVIGIAQVCFALYQRELTSNRFLKIAEKNFTFYPIEQIIFFLGGLMSFCRKRNSREAYLLAQSMVVHFTLLAHDLPPQVFNCLFVPFQRKLPILSDITLSREEELRVKTFMTYACAFKYHHQKIKKCSPACAEEEVQKNIDMVISAKQTSQVLRCPLQTTRFIRQECGKMQKIFKQASEYYPSKGIEPPLGYSEEARSQLIQVLKYTELSLNAYFELPPRVLELAKKEP